MVTAEGIPLAFDETYYLERACKNIVLSMQLGDRLKRVDHGVLKDAAKYYDSKMLELYAARHFYSYWNLYMKEQPDVFS